jgi:hypothetical protein
MQDLRRRIVGQAEQVPASGATQTLDERGPERAHALEELAPVRWRDRGFGSARVFPGSWGSGCGCPGLVLLRKLQDDEPIAA